MENTESRGTNNYEIWVENPDAQRDIFQITEALCSYLHDNEVKSILLVDSAARPAWKAITTYWNIHFPTDSRPDIYFINPVGIKPSAEVVDGIKQPTQDAQKLMNDKYGKGYGYPEDEITRIRTQEEILEEFSKTYSQLMKHRDKPTLVFDVCIHTGEAMEAILKTLEHLGFEDTRTGVTNIHRNTSELNLDFIAHKGIPKYPCHVFSFDSAVDKTFAQSHSLKSSDMSMNSREWLERVRFELGQIIEHNGEYKE